MKTNSKSMCRSIIVGSVLLLLVGGCSKNTIIFDYPDGNDSDEGSSNGGSNTTALITFNASIEGRNMTRSIAPMKTGVAADVMAYTSGGSTLNDPLTSGTYVTKTPGVLGGKNGYKMNLPNGEYDFYAVSDNYSLYPPLFVLGESEPLSNGIDYLWWRQYNQDIKSSQVGIPIVFLHACTQVVFEIVAGEDMVLNSLQSVTITPPVPGARMSLETGIIPYTTVYSTVQDKMGFNGFLAQYIMLPLNTQNPMGVTINLLANGERIPRTYTVKVPVPDATLKAGNSYLFKAVIDENTVTFPSVSVKEWVEIDETGKPLYPLQ